MQEFARSVIRWAVPAVTMVVLGIALPASSSYALPIVNFKAFASDESNSAQPKIENVIGVATLGSFSSDRSSAQHLAAAVDVGDDTTTDDIPPVPLPENGTGSGTEDDDSAGGGGDGTQAVPEPASLLLLGAGLTGLGWWNRRTLSDKN